MKPLLEVKHLQTTFQASQRTVKAVDDVSFSIERGGRLGIVGESGSGKSITALSILNLILPPGKIVGGEVLFSDNEKTVDLLKISENELRAVRGRKIAMVFQEAMTSLNPVFTIGDQILEVVTLHQHLTGTQAWDKVLESLSWVKISDPARVAKSYPHELSGGMRQRAMIAMALVCQPDLLIADEPTTALDVTIQAQVLDLLKDIQQKMGMALILITHDLGIVAETVDHVLVMKSGKIVEQASVMDIFQKPQHPYTQALLKALPVWAS